jgi:hypothetical protein
VDALPAAAALGDTVTDLGLGTTDGLLDLLEGQEVYLEADTTLSVVIKSEALRVEVEWMPQEV